MNSPCIKKCELFEGKCLGCGRTLEEIRNWRNLSDTDKKKIINRIKNENLHP